MANSKVDMLDIGHPVIQNLIKKVKEDTFNEPDNYGRNSIVASETVDKPTAIYYYLIRYVAHTIPYASILEEILPIGIEIYENREINEIEIEKISNSKLVPIKMTLTEKKDEIQTSLECDILNEAINNKIETRRLEIQTSRSEIKIDFEKTVSKTAKRWLKGFDEIEIGSIDLLCVIVYEPEEVS